jgi:hypothetical protein
MYYKIFNTKNELVTCSSLESDAISFVKCSGRDDLVIYECDWNTGKKIRKI